MKKGMFDAFGALSTGKVVAHEVRMGPDNEPETDRNGNVIPTGLLRIELLDKAETREHVPYCLPTAGNSSFMGSLPEIGTLCIVGWRAQHRPVILGFLPFGLDNTSEARQTVPTLEPGEVLLQGSKTDLSADGTPNVFPGPRLWFDRVGRVRLDATDYSLLIGYMLDNEYSLDRQYLNDPVTDQPVLLRERVGTVERRVDRSGNEVRMVGLDSIVKTAGNAVTETGGAFRVTAKDGISIQDAKRNGVFVGETDDVTVQAKATAKMTSGGTTEVEAAGDLLLNALGQIAAMSGDNLVLIGGKAVQLKSVLGAIELQALAGGIKMLTPFTIDMLSVTGDVVIAAPLGKVAVGVPLPLLAVNPFVMGIGMDVLLGLIAAALTAMVPGLVPTAQASATAAIAALTTAISSQLHKSKTVFGGPL
jgi:hypothetical protein